jgi:hypothetical protein
MKRKRFCEEQIIEILGCTTERIKPDIAGLG